jgi:predicted metal-dependent peptidase
MTAKPKTGDHWRTLAEARLFLRQHVPFFTTAIVSLVPREAPGLGTLGVTRDYVLHFDPEWLAAQGPYRTAALLLHEIAHPMRGHHRRLMETFGAELGNLGGDLAINPDVESICASVRAKITHGERAAEELAARWWAVPQGPRDA